MLQLQLKRFEYDFQRDSMVKVGRGGGWVAWGVGTVTVRWALYCIGSV